MKKISYMLFMWIIIWVAIVGVHGENVKIENVRTSNVLISLDGSNSEYYIKPDLIPTIYVDISNEDPYQNNIIVEIKSDDGNASWRSKVIPIPPNSRNIVVSAKLNLKKFGPNNIYITLLNEDGKIIDSKKATIYIANPIDVVNITCMDSYVNKSKPDVEVCNSQWFNIILRNNNYSESDYRVKVWIAVVSQDFNKDASEYYEDDDNVLYYGESNSKTVYIPKGGMAEVHFKIPKITHDKDTIKIQVHMDIYGIHDYADGPAYTNINIDDKYSVKYSRNIKSKSFAYPISVDNFEVVTKINESVVDILKKYYRRSNIIDPELDEVLSDYRYYKDNQLLPRAYLKEDPYLAIIKITLKNRFNDKTHGVISIKSDIDKATSNIDLDGFETKDIYMPILVGYSENSVNLSVCSIETYEYRTTEDLNVKPIGIPVVRIEDVILCCGDNKYLNLSGSYINMFSKKNYTLKITIKNYYNKSLSGNLTLTSKDFNENIAKYPSKTPFYLRPHEEKTIDIPIYFNVPAKGDIKFTLEVNDALLSYSKLIHFNAQNIDVSIKYTGPNRPKVMTTNNKPIYQNLPVAGYKNKFTVVYRNPLDEDIKLKTWIKVTREDGTIEALTHEKIIDIPPNDERSVDFEIKFDNGFYGMLQVYALPIDKNYNASNITPVLVEFIKVICPLSIINMKYNNSIVYAEVAFNNMTPYPNGITYNYWFELVNNDKIVFKSKTYNKTIYPNEVNRIRLKLMDVNDTNSTLKLYVKIPDFVMINGEYYPIIITKHILISNNEKTMGINISNNEKTMGINNRSLLENNTIIDNLNKKISKDNITTTTEKNTGNKTEINSTSAESMNKGIIETVYLIISNTINNILSLFGW
ncbi:MAG TPA: hypothetical protein EYG76_03510 [Methanothermococcus okinawensis]|uniref:Uncharacterized protein n=1 Tax=Methanothermococcus okinawensis TaxID=155863 RepID=A0A832YTG7_9EURY|nr:hypothetical protein [Methanothermococcus okinawensis]